MKIAVVGAGIVGLSSAVCIQADFPDVEVTIIAELVEHGTTSDGAAGFFHPDNVNVDSPADLEQWIKDSAEHYWNLCYSEIAPETGIFEISGYTVSNFDMKLIEDPVFHKYVKNFRRLEGFELDKVGGGPWRYGTFKTTLITEPRIMMDYLFKKFTSKKGCFRQEKLSCLSELVGQFDLVVNCTGLGARNLVGDNSMYPIRGQVLRVKAPWIKHFYMAEDDTYILPNGELVVVGGTRQKQNWSTDLSSEDRADFMERNCRILPSLQKATPVREWVGLRPGRPTIRLEMEKMQLPGDKILPVIHNYGHSGNGIALSWGCAVHVAKIAREVALDASSQ